VESKVTKYQWDIDFRIRGFADINKPTKRTYLWKVNFLIIGYKMLGFRVLKILVDTYFFKKKS